MYLYEKHVRTIILEDLECYKDTLMKAYDITKLTAKLKVTAVCGTEIKCSTL